MDRYTFFGVLGVSNCIWNWHVNKLTVLFESKLNKLKLFQMKRSGVTYWSFCALLTIEATIDAK